MRSIRYFFSEFRAQRASFVYVRPKEASNSLAHSLLFIELAGERIVAAEASTKLSFLFFFLVGYSILCT